MSIRESFRVFASGQVGIKTKVVKVDRYSRFRFDDTLPQISAQLASKHTHSQLNSGHPTQPRRSGHGQARGEGAEPRTDATASLRAAKDMPLTTCARTQASGGQLDRGQLIRRLRQCAELFNSLGDHAGEHGGPRARRGCVQGPDIPSPESVQARACQ